MKALAWLVVVDDETGRVRTEIDDGDVMRHGAGLSVVDAAVLHQFIELML